MLTALVGRVSRFPLSRLASYRSFSSNSASSFEKDAGGDDPEDQPISNLANPYEKPKAKCILCAQKITLDYKNARLLQQFVSNFSGRVYERHITGLCEKQQQRLLAAIAESRKTGYMPVVVKDPRYLRDPKLFDPMRPMRPHPYA